MNIYVEVYGCTANKSDAAVLHGLIQNNSDIHIVDDINQATYIILLTCTVIATTEQRMISRIKTLQQTGKIIIVSGCMASIQDDMLKEMFPDIILVPPQKTHTIIDIIKEKKQHHIAQKKYDVPKSFHSPIAPIAIAEGCWYQCSYCITSLARGDLQSVPADIIYRDVEHALQQGCLEIQLTAQDTASYGSDTDESLGTLLDRLSSIHGLYRIRVGMMNPRSVLTQMDDIINGMNNSAIFKFLHLPVQSGDDTILAKMNRGYDMEDFYTIVTTFRTAFPTLTLSTDIIVGFPGETEEQFQKSLDLLKKIKPDIINITRYSQRPFTKAKTMNNFIPTNIVKQRSRTITSFSKSITENKNKSYIDKTFEVFILESGKPGSVIARTDSYKPVVIKHDLPIGTIEHVKITEVTEAYLIGILK